MRLILTRHVEYRLAQRNSTESDLVAIIRHPQKPRRDDEGNPIYVGIVRGWTVQVVNASGSTPPRVITVKVTR